MDIITRLPRISIYLARCILVAIMLGVGFSREIAFAKETTQQPIEVEIGLKIDDIVEVDKQRESFKIVGSLRMDWKDPRLAYDTKDCQCKVAIYEKDDFADFVEVSNDRWPEFTFYNQHGDRLIQNQVVVVYPDGSAYYFERFTADFHDNFNFRRFPFDRQQFNIYVDLLYPEDIYILKELKSYSSISEENGEEEIVLSSLTTQVSSVESSTGIMSSRYTVQFEGPRHLEYYIFRIFFPIAGILLISWIVIFLKDYQKRVELTLANIVLFITFSFSLSDNYPRLGYPTFLDAIMTITLMANIVVVLFHVYLKTLENKEKFQQVERIDRLMGWLYPIGLVIVLLVTVGIFF